MIDIVSKKKRSNMMSGIRTKGTIAELKVWEALKNIEVPFELDRIFGKKKPDIVVSQKNTVILVHGCFWHVHECYRFKWPDDNSEYWLAHLKNNAQRDKKNQQLYLRKGWRVLTVWECAIVGRKRLNPQTLSCQLAEFLMSEKEIWSICGE